MARGAGRRLLGKVWGSVPTQSVWPFTGDYHKWSLIEFSYLKWVKQCGRTTLPCPRSVCVLLGTDPASASPWESSALP